MSLFSRLSNLFSSSPPQPQPAGAATGTPWWDRDLPLPPAGARIHRMVVNNRVFLLGLDWLYREAMKGHERVELLACARRVAKRLAVTPADVPIEGYYGDEPALREYFRLMRGLQAVPLERERDVAEMAEFQRLLAVTSSPIFGPPLREFLLPKGKDPLSAALIEVPWALPTLLSRAQEVARATDDYSLVGLAARAGDPVALAALRESVVLYALDVTLASTVWTEYQWAVDPEVAAAAERFVEAFNSLMGPGLPRPIPTRAWVFASAFKQTSVVGRCVRLGEDRDRPAPFYHWVIVPGEGDALAVREFWDARIWTTDDYRKGGAPGTTTWVPGRDAAPGRITKDFRAKN